MNSIVSITHCSSTDRLQLATSKNSQKNNRKKRKNNFIDHSMTPACTVHKNTSPLSFFFFLSFRFLNETGIKKMYCKKENKQRRRNIFAL